MNSTSLVLTIIAFLVPGLFLVISVVKLRGLRAEIEKTHMWRMYDPHETIYPTLNQIIALKGELRQTRDTEERTVLHSPFSAVWSAVVDGWPGRLVAIRLPAHSRLDGATYKQLRRWNILYTVSAWTLVVPLQLTLLYQLFWGMMGNVVGIFVCPFLAFLISLWCINALIKLILD